MKLLATVLIILSLAGSAQSACRQALALGLDVSGSVDEHEYRLQLDGLAAALEAPQVQRAFMAMPQAPVWLAVFQWSGLGQQRLLVNWVEITEPAQLRAVSGRLRGASSAYTDPSTAIGSAVLYGVYLLNQRQACWKRTLDISGDGPSNRGPAPGNLSDTDLAGITVNGLVVGPQARANINKNLAAVKTLQAYYETEVIRGPGAFVEVATGFDDFERAMTLKLIRELEEVIVSHALPGISDR